MNYGMLLSLGLLIFVSGCFERAELKGQPVQRSQEIQNEVVDSIVLEGPSSVDNGFDSSEARNETDADAEARRSAAVNDRHSISLKADIIFAIDTSASMNDEIAAVQANLARFISSLQDGRLDVRMHLMLDRPLQIPAGVDPKKLAFIDQEVGSENAISRLNMLLSGAYASRYRTAQGAVMPSPLEFRPDAAQEIVIISDDNGEGTGNLANDFLQVNNKKSIVNAIIGLPTSRNVANCDIASVGNEYLLLTRETRGTALDICSSDWSALINRLSQDIIKRSTSFVLSQKPAESPGFIVKVDNRELAKNDWSYNSETNTIIILKQDVIKDGSSVSIAYNS